MRIFLICLFLLIWLGSHPGMSSELIEKTEPDAEREETPMDWSKPVVSRGFGYSPEGAENQQWVNQYKSGQVLYFFGDYKKALENWLPLVEKNYAEAQASVAWMYQAGLGVAKDEKKALSLYRHAADQGNAIAQNNLGVFYEQGIVVEKNLVVARQWFKKSAENGYRFAAYNYANFLLQGLGGEKNLQQAIFWYRKAADQQVKQARDKLNELVPVADD